MAKEHKEKEQATGETYTTKNRHIAPPRTTGKDCERRLKCFEKVNDMQRLEILQPYNSIDDRKLQDNYLNCCIETQPTTRKRPRNGDRVTGKGSKSFTYTFTVKPNAPKITVCPSAFMSLHGIGRTRLKVIRGPATTLPLIDMRGRHNNHYSLPAAIKIQMHNHIKSFPKRESHYSQHDDNNRRYLDEMLNVGRMGLLYLHKHGPKQKCFIGMISNR